MTAVTYGRRNSNPQERAREQMVKQERAIRTRESLILAAAEVFAEEGYVPASLTTISRRAGVSNGALHFHFENKQALALAVEAEATRALGAITAEASQAEEGVLQELVGATHALMARLAQDVVVRAGFELGTGSARGAGTCRLGWQRWVEEALSRAAREGSLADGVSPQDAAGAIVAATVGFEVLGAQDPGWYTGRAVTGFWELLLPRLKRDYSVCSPPL
ncbi:ScbR family autoregulator-binding transcription factor [Streptomyces sp. NPDC091272]|uniref:ScbR family autoregulator-binding transcription factor n=1 Tax=Streptomyces sp. NPDC091272 TaxID=3365981 RepID=UPI0038298B9C